MCIASHHGKVQFWIQKSISAVKLRKFSSKNFAFGIRFAHLIDNRRGDEDHGPRYSPYMHVYHFSSRKSSILDPKVHFRHHVVNLMMQGLEIKESELEERKKEREDRAAASDFSTT